MSRALPRPTRPMWLKIALVASAIAALPLIVAGVALVDVNRATVELGARELHLSVIETVSERIAASLSGAQDGLDTIGRTLTDASIAEDARVSLALHVLSGNAALDHCAIYDASGARIDVLREAGATSEPPEQLDAGQRAEADARGVAIGTALRASAGPRVPVIVPLRADGQVTGYASSLVSLEGVGALVNELTQARFEGRPQSLLVVDAQRRVLAGSAPLEVARGIGILDDVRGGDFSSGVALSGEFVGGDGVLYVGSLQPMRAQRWAVIAQTPSSVVYASITRMRLIVAAVFALAVLLAVLSAVLLGRRLARPARALVAFADDLAARRFEKRLVLQTGDELGVVAAALSHAAEDLQASDQRIREEVAIRTDLGRYLAADLVERVVRREQDLELGGHRGVVSVLFADVVGFTPMTRKLQPEQVVAMLNELFTMLTAVVFKHGGTVDKFIGDCVMAFWGAPTPQDDHAERALAAAEDMIAILEVGNANWEKQYGVTVQLAIGVNSGEAIIGNIGSETRMEYTLIGDTVNVAARLEAIARPQQILLTRATWSLAREAFDFRDLGAHELAGRKEPVHLFEVRTA